MGWHNLGFCWPWNEEPDLEDALYEYDEEI